MRINSRQFLYGLRHLLPASLLLLASCGGGGGGAPAAPPPPTSFTIGGGVNGLTASGLVLRNNGGDDLAVAASSVSYTFSTSVASGGSYNVTVLTQPTGQVCTIANASGSSLSANVTNANVTCLNAYTISGNITSTVAGIGPTLQNNLGDNLFVPAIINGSTPFTFSTPVVSGSTYSVTQLVKARTPNQDCVVTSGGTGTAVANVIDVLVTCTATAAVPKFAYVVSYNSNTLRGYTIDSVTGVLTSAGTPVTTGMGPYSVVVDPSSRFAYVPNSLADSIWAYSINATTGALTAMPDVDGGTAGTQTSIVTGDVPFSIAIHPSGKFAYVANQGVGTNSGNTISAYSIDATTGALSAMDANGATAGTQTTIATGTHPYAITIDPTGNFAYVANYDSNTVSVYTVNQTTGALTAGTPVAAGTNPGSIAIDPTGKCALVANNTSNDVSAYTINQTTGALTSAGAAVASGTGSSAPRSVAIDPATGLFAYVANAGGKSITAASWSASTATFTTSTAHGYQAGAIVHVSGVNPTGYNGTHTIVTVPTSTTFTVAIGTDPGAYTSGGAIAEGSVAAFSVNPTTCVIASIDTDAVTGGTNATIAAGTTPFSISVDPSGKYVYVANFGSHNVSAYSIDIAGALTALGTSPFATGTGPTSITTAQ